MTFSLKSPSCYLKLPIDYSTLCIHVVVSPDWFITSCMFCDGISVYPSPAHVRRPCDYNLLIDTSRAVPVYYDDGPQRRNFPGNGNENLFSGSRLADRNGRNYRIGRRFGQNDATEDQTPFSRPSTITAYNMPFFFQGQALVNKTTMTRVPA